MSNVQCGLVRGVPEWTGFVLPVEARLAPRTLWTPRGGPACLHIGACRPPIACRQTRLRVLHEAESRYLSSLVCHAYGCIGGANCRAYEDSNECWDRNGSRLLQSCRVIVGSMPQQRCLHRHKLNFRIAGSNRMTAPDDSCPVRSCNPVAGC